MTTPTKAKAFIQSLLKPWWWSPCAPCAYRTGDGRGWFMPAIEHHPGMFNLMWATSGIRDGVTDVTNYACNVWWAICDGDRVKISGYTLADHAATLTLAEFDELIRHNRLDLSKQQFHSNMTALKLLRLINDRRKTCA
jgi:hypothetical protein